MSSHLYADDTQLYLAFDNEDPVSKGNAQSQLELCIEGTKCWMHWNMLKLNGDRTESLHFLPDLKHNPLDIIEAISIGSDTISADSEARNLGVFFIQISL